MGFDVGLDVGLFEEPEVGEDEVPEVGDGVGLGVARKAGEFRAITMLWLLW